MLPGYNDDGYLPEGLHRASEAEVLFRFGSATPHRRRLAIRLRRWIELARSVGARRLLVDGSFVTAKDEPWDVDAVVLLPIDFVEQIERNAEMSLELEQVLMTRRPEELFAAEDDSDWDEWVEFFSRTREPDGRRKGLVEVQRMIQKAMDYQKAEQELKALEARLSRLQANYPTGSKGFTKAGVRKLIARLHEELAIYEASEEARRPEAN